MKTKKFFTIVRLMTFMVAMGLFSLSTYAYTTNDNGANTFSGGETEISEETVEKLDLEPWMVSEDFWSLESGVRSTASETIVLEEWMTSPSFFQTSEEQELNTIENWMLEESFWTI